MKGLFDYWGSLFLLSVVLLLGACEAQDASSNDNEGKINIITTIAQIGEPLSVIGGEFVEVHSLMGPAVDPHLYQATHGDITKVEQADMVFHNGLGLEANMVEIFNNMSQSKTVIAIGETIAEDLLLADEEGSVDPHIWLELDLWKEALDAAVEAIKEHAPEQEEYFEKNKEDYFAQIDKLKEEAKKLQDIPQSQRYLVTAHDAFGYFGNMHGLEVIGLQGLSTDGEIGVSDIQETIDIIIEYGVPAVFIESSISDSTIMAVIEGAKSAGVEVSLGGELFSDAMGEAGTEEGTYLGMYRHNVNTIYDALMKGAE